MYSFIIIGVRSVQRGASNLLICQTQIRCMSCVVSPSKTMTLNFNLIYDEKVYPFWLSWKWDASLLQRIVESDALMV